MRVTLKFSLRGIIYCLFIITLIHHSIAKKNSKLCKKLLTATNIWDDGKGKGFQNFILAFKNLCIEKEESDTRILHGTEMSAEAIKKILTMALVESYSDDLYESHKFNTEDLTSSRKWCEVQSNIVATEFLSEENGPIDVQEISNIYKNRCIDFFAIFGILSRDTKYIFQKMYRNFTIFSLDYEHQHYFQLLGRPLDETEQFYMKKFLIPYYKYILEEVEKQIKPSDSETYKTIKVFCKTKETHKLMIETSKVLPMDSR